MKIVRTAAIVLCFMFFLSILIPSASADTDKAIPTPAEWFGHEIGAEGRIIDYARSLDYYRLIARVSDKAVFTELGKTTDGNPFVLMIISHPDTIERLDELRDMRDMLSDPRRLERADAEQLADRLPAVVFHTGSIHSSEISTAQVPPLVIHELVTSESEEIERILENTIILYSPSANPDGQFKYNEWYAEQAGQPWEGRMPWLYHSYIGHDNNRDWVMLHFPEQRLTATEIHLKWHPLYSLEMHEMGSSGARMFVPPYLDPHDPNTAPQVVSTMNVFGMAISHRLTSEGKAGVVVNAIFDLFTPARAFQVYHGTGRILTETARGNFARTLVQSPSQIGQSRYGSASYKPLTASWNFPMPWMPGTWTLKDRIDYQVSANFALLNYAATHRRQLNMSYYNALAFAVEGAGWPTAYVFPAEQHDPGAAARLLGLMQLGGIEVHRAAEAFTADGREYPVGSHVIYLRQPYGAWAKTLLEIQKYPDLRDDPDDPPVVPYDVTGHTLPLLMGVEATPIQSSLEGSLELVKERIASRGTINGEGNWYTIMPTSNDAYAAVDALMDEGIAVYRNLNKLTVNDVTLVPGTFAVEAGNGAEEQLKELAVELGFKAMGMRGKLPGAGLIRLADPRLALYEPWGGSMDAGWTRLVLEQYGMEFTLIRNADILDGNLSGRFDTIVFPGDLRAQQILEGSDSWPTLYRGGLGAEGLTELETFVRNGGTVVTWGWSSGALAELMDVPLHDVTDELTINDFFNPGSIVLTELDTAHPVNLGMPGRAAVMVRRTPVFEPQPSVEEIAEVAGTFPDYDARLSGFLLGEKHLRSTPSISIQQRGAGRIILFAYQPLFRAMTHGSYKQLFNAALWAAQERSERKGDAAEE